ncbi:MAG: transporter associated domain-containing protein, partial [Vampirovibrionia bacterium]
GSACVSIYWGITRLTINTDVSELYLHFNWIAAALVCSVMFEVWAINNASKAILAESDIESKNPITCFLMSVSRVNKVKSPTTRFVWYEDTAALTGVLIALVALMSSRYLVDYKYAHIPDGVASLLIGFILLFLAIYLFKNYLSNLGAAAKPQIEQIIKEVTLNVNNIIEVNDLKTMDMGASGLIVNMEIEVEPEIQVKDVDDITEKIEAKLKQKLPNISHVNIEVQADETENNWRVRFKSLIDEGIKNEIINHQEAKILENFYEFTETTVEEIMVPRTEINCLGINSSIDNLVKLVIETGHTRIPIYEDSVDNIIGLIHSKDLLKIYQNRIENHENPQSELDLRSLLRSLPIVPINKPISKMLNEFITNKIQMALIADEHGGIDGLVTIEDLLEEIFGEIWDEYDVETVDIKRIDKNSVLLSAKVNIEEINERYDLDIPSEEFNTIGGYIFGILGRVPKINDEIKVDSCIFTVDKMNSYKLQYIKLYNPLGLVDKVEQEELEIQNGHHSE